LGLETARREITVPKSIFLALSDRPYQIVRTRLQHLTDGFRLAPGG